MHPYVLIPLAACVLSTAFAVALLLRDQGDPALRIATALFLGAGWWAFWETAWNLAPDAETALVLLKVSSPGWTLLGPLGVHAFVELGAGGSARRWLPALYVAGGCFLVASFTSDLLTRRMVPVAWGYGYDTGPLFPAYLVFTACCGACALWSWLRKTRHEPLLTDRPARVAMSLGFVIALAFSSATDGILPLLDVHVPQLGTLSFATFAMLVLWTHVQRGYLFVSPTVFASEILATLPDGVALVDARGVVRLANAGLARMLCLRRELVVGARLADWLRAEPTDARQALHERECELLPPGGAPLPVSVSTTPLLDRRGQPLGTVVLVRDLAEVVELRRRVVTSGRLAAVGQLAAGIAHEINNPIAFVRTNLGLLREHWGRLEKQLSRENGGARSPLRDVLEESEELIDESLQGVDRAAAIVRDVQGFSRVGEGRRELVDLHEVLDQVVRFAMPERFPDVAVEKCYAEAPLVVAASPQLKQVFLNLVLNGLQAVACTGRPGRLEIATSLAKREVLISFTDDGCGIPPENLDRVFDPFFTTKPEGTGLGLAISHEIVRSANGSLTARAGEDGGARFEVRLPRDASEA